MGLRDRLRLLVRPPTARPEPPRAEPERPSAPPPVRVPRAVVSPPFGATLVQVGEGPAFPGASRLPIERWRELRGPVCVVSPGDGGRAASAAAERLAAWGVESTWLQGGSA